MTNKKTSNTAFNGKKILIVLASFELGGSENQALQLAQYLKNNENCQVEVVAFGKPAILSDLCDEYDIPWKSLPFPWSNLSIKKYIRLIKFGLAIRKLKPDILISYTTWPNVICGLTWKMTGARLCIWNQRDVIDGIIDVSIERKAIYNVPIVVTNSLNGKDYLINKFKIDSNKIEVIRNSVQLKEIKWNRNQWRSYLGINESAQIVCMAANLSQFKDHATLLHAWSIVVNKSKLEKTPQIMLILAGRFGETYSSLVKLVEDLNIQNFVKFLGPVSDISGLLNASDIGVLSSLYEGSPNALQEYMASGLPFIASDIPGIREITPDSQIPFLFPPKDSSSFAELLLKLMSDSHLRMDSGRINKKYVNDNFNPDIINAHYQYFIVKNLME